MGGKKVIQLNRENYSKLLKDFSDFFVKDFPGHFDAWEILDFSMEVWNISNMKKILPINDFLETAILAEEMEETSLLFEKMIAYKMNHYGGFDKFILDYDLDLEDDSTKLEVVTGDIDDYKEVLEASTFDDDMEMEGNLANRNAIILKPKKIFVDWVLKVDEDEVDEKLIMETKIYLIDDLEYDPEEWLEENFNELFDSELEFWCSMPDQWPQNRTFSVFRKWFDINFSTLVYDLEDI